MNLIEANTRIQEPAFPLHDCMEIIDGISDCRVFSALDLKAGFLNVPVHPDW